MIDFLKLNICGYLRNKSQVFSRILTSFRQWSIILPINPPSPTNQTPEKPNLVGVNVITFRYMFSSEGLSFAWHQYCSDTDCQFPGFDKYISSTCNDLALPAGCTMGSCSFTLVIFWQRVSFHFPFSQV